MITDTELKIKAVQILRNELGDVETEKFISLILKEPFDYTRWQRDILNNLSAEDISKKAMALRKSA